MSPELRASALIVVPRSGGGFDEVNAGDSYFSLERTVTDKVPSLLVPPRAARRCTGALGD